MKLKCPTCRTEYEYINDEENPYFPFCSQRCRLVDLGNWLDGDYTISTPLKEADPEETEAMIEEIENYRTPPEETDEPL